MSLNLKQLEYMVLGEDILYHKKHIGNPMETSSVLIDRPVVLSCM